MSKETKYTGGEWIADTSKTDQYSGYQIRSGVRGDFPIAHVRATYGPDHTDRRNDTDRANARLIAASPELYEAQTMGAQVNTPDFLDWMADRLVNVYNESPNVDFVLSLRARAAAGRAAIRKAETGESK